MSNNHQLATYAVIEENSKGRHHYENYDDATYRSIFGRDRDRIINSAAFRRLQYKTQVFVNHQGDHYRTRLTHSLEVAQTARWIAGALRLNKDLAEIVALAHDLGHPPFGHAGEEALNDQMYKLGQEIGVDIGFSHNAHTLKIVTKLETRFIEFEGLNLSWEILEGIVKHNGPIHDQGLLVYLNKYLGGNSKAYLNQYIFDYNQHYNLDLNRQSSLEAQIAAIADDITYNNHDIEDGLRAGLFDVEQLFELPLVGDIYKEILSQYPTTRRELLVGEAKKRLTLEMVIDAIHHTYKNITENNIYYEDDVRNHNKSLVNFSEEMEEVHQILKNFLMKHVYRHSEVNRMTARARRVISDLFNYYYENPDCLPTLYKEQAEKISYKKDLAILISDYIAGMTDRYAIKEHDELINIRG